MKTELKYCCQVSVVWATWPAMSDTNESCTISQANNRRFTDKVGTTIWCGSGGLYERGKDSIRTYWFFAFCCAYLLLWRASAKTLHGADQAHISDFGDAYFNCNWPSFTERHSCEIRITNLAFLILFWKQKAEVFLVNLLIFRYLRTFLASNE